MHPAKRGPAVVSGDCRILDQVHCGLGHCPNRTLVRILKFGKARPELVRAAATWRCASCAIRKGPERPRAARPPTTYEFNEVLDLNVIFIADNTGEKRRALNMVRWGAVLHVVVLLENREATSYRTA